MEASISFDGPGPGQKPSGHRQGSGFKSPFHQRCPQAPQRVPLNLIYMGAIQVHEGPEIMSTLLKLNVIIVWREERPIERPDLRALGQRFLPDSWLVYNLSRRYESMPQRALVDINPESRSRYLGEVERAIPTPVLRLIRRPEAQVRSVMRREPYPLPESPSGSEIARLEGHHGSMEAVQGPG